MRQLFTIMMAMFFIIPSATAAERYYVNAISKDADYITIKDGDFTANIHYLTKVKIWSIFGEPVVNCWHKITEVQSVSYKGEFVHNIPQPVIAKISMDVDAHLFDLVHGNFAVASFICQSGVGKGFGKWGDNFPGSPNWGRFLFNIDTSYGRQYPSDDEHYTKFEERVNFVSAGDAKAFIKNALKVKYAVTGRSFPDYRGDLGAVKEWYKDQKEKDVLAQNDELARAMKREKEAQQAVADKNDFLSELDNEEYKKVAAKEMEGLAADGSLEPLKALNQIKDTDRTPWQKKEAYLAEMKRLGLEAMIAGKSKYPGTIAVASIQNNQTFKKNVVQAQGHVSKFLVGKGELYASVNGYTQQVALSQNGDFKSAIVLAAGANTVKLEFLTSNKTIMAQSTLNLTYSGKRSRLRATLTWDGNGSDLDLHVKGPAGHCYFEAKNVRNMSLDVDNTKGYGPENISTYPGYPGNYSIEVKNYANGRGNTATVYIYVDEALESVKKHQFSHDEEVWSVDTINLN
ncbi:MAG: hypothetical protein Q9M09_02825 [Mariprofundaceae bacterium]|nr:hypothetical protein [Mariprofundaceae bacterium]